MLTTPEVTLIVAGVALAGTGITVIQSRITGRRDAWWRRTRWAMERIIASQNPDDTERTIGLSLLLALQGSHLASNEERAMLEEVADAILATVPARPDTAGTH